MERGNQEREFKRDLQGVASDLKWSIVELLRVADHQLVPFQNVARSMVRVLGFQDVAAMSPFQV